MTGVSHRAAKSFPKTEKESHCCSVPLRVFLFFSLLVLLGCARMQNAPPGEPVVEQVTAEKAEEHIAEDSTVDGLDDGRLEEPGETSSTKPRFAVIPPNARPGEPVTVGYSDNFEGENRSFQAVLLDSRGRQVTRAFFFNMDRLEGEPALLAAVFAVPSTVLIGNAVIRVESGEEIIGEIPFLIDHREFRSETIALNQANTDLRTRPDPQRTAEAEQLWAILNRTGTVVYSNGPMIPPLTSTRRTSLYGSRRVYEYADGRSDTTIHAGVDYGVPTGTEITASAAGRVALARNRIITGHTVILEHLPGLYSLYYHLDSIAVSEGSLVEPGTYLGASGATGLATGPHLHWEIRVSGENADPDAFLSRPVLDKNEILNKLGIAN